jgi:putative hydrolase of the HAD superfamily
MVQIDPEQLVCVFDLDDTLYKEVDYRASGLKEICSWIARCYDGVNAHRIYKECASHKDAIACICNKAGLPSSSKESLLWIYRLHNPTIKLEGSVRTLLDRLQEISQVAILTDGRSVTQRLKLQALGLSHLPAYISEEHQSSKPHPHRFEQIMRDFPNCGYAYIADNPKKDFVAPNRLGWLTIGIKGGVDNIHSQDLGGLRDEYFPAIWVEDFSKISEILGIP